MSPSRRHPELSREQIIATALELLDGYGEHELSIRALARRLGVTPMAIYWHLPNKDALLDGVLEAVLSEIDPDGIPADPFLALEEIARRYRATFAAHPHAADLLAIRPTPDGPVARALMTGTLSLLRATGLSEPDAASAYALLSQFVMGCVLAEHVGSDELPAILSELDLSGVPAAAERFEFGLGVLLSGLREHARRSAPGDG